MKRINSLLILSILTFVFASSNQKADGVLSLKKQLLAKQLEYKNAVKNSEPVDLNDYGILKEKSNQLNNFRNECYDFDNEDECIIAGCMWDDEEGCYRGSDDEDWEEDANECFSDCEDIENINPEGNPAEACDWLISIFGTGCFSDCDEEFLEDVNFIVESCYECLNSAVLDCSGAFGDADDPYNPDEDLEGDCDPDLSCAAVLTCVNGLLYPTSCGPENCDDPIGECDDLEDECFGLPYEECEYLDFCVWVSDSDNPNSFGSCVESENVDDGGWNDDGGWDDGGNPEECGEGYLFDCSNDGDCCPEGWIGDGFSDCEDQAWGCDLSCYDNDGGDCEENSGDDGDFECSDLGYEECMYYDFCDWVDSNLPSSSGYCIDAGEEDGGDDGDDCFDIYDCVGTPACDFLMWLGDGICDDGTWGINFNCEDYNFDEGDCEDTGDDGGWDECSDLSQDECIENEFCDWSIVTTPSGVFEMCIEIDSSDDGGWDDGGNPDECGEGYLFDCSNDGDCCPESWIGDGYPDCQDQSYGCDLSCYDNDGGDCEENGDGGNDDGGNNNEFAALIIGDSTTGTPGSELEIPLFYESNTLIAGIQFTISDSPDWAVGVDIISHVDDCFEVDSNDVNGDVIGILFSLQGCELAESDSATHFASIVYELSPNAEWGSTIDLYFEEAIVADVNGESIPVDVVGGSINISLIGDINSDSEINVLDVVSLINFILFVDNPSDYQFWVSDINADGDLNVLDVVLLVGLILD